MSQALVDVAMTLEVGPALTILVEVYGREARTYCVGFTDDGKWSISVMNSDNGKVFARYAKDLE